MIKQEHSWHNVSSAGATWKICQISLFHGRHFDNSQLGKHIKVINCCTALTYRAIINLINNACAIPPTTSPNICCEKGLTDYFCIYLLTYKGVVKATNKQQTNNKHSRNFAGEVRNPQKAYINLSSMIYNVFWYYVYLFP